MPGSVSLLVVFFDFICWKTVLWIDVFIQLLIVDEVGEVNGGEFFPLHNIKEDSITAIAK